MGERYKKKDYFVNDFMDTRELKTLSKKLKDSQRTLWQVMDTIPSAIFWKDKKLKYLGCNKSFARSIKLSVKEIVGKDDYEIGWHELGDSYREDDRYIIETGESKLNYEEQIIQPNGDIIWGRTSKMPLYDSDGNIYGVLGVFEDITERKKSEEALRESQLRYEQLAEKSRSVAWEVDKDGMYTYISPVVKELYGYCPEEVIGKMYFYDFFEEDIRDSSKESILSKMEKRESLSDYENKINHKNNEDIWVSTNAFPIGKIAINMDILTKKEKLSKKDWAEIRRHPEVGYIILNSSMEYASFAEDVLYHHERYDGKGYPKGLKGKKIPLNSRIIALADAYSAMTNERAYRKAMAHGKAIEIIKEESGKQFDPKIVEAFLKNLPNIE